VFTFQDILGNTGSVTATISNWIFLGGGAAYIVYPVATENWVTVDYCPNGDMSPSRYDRVCRGITAYTGTYTYPKQKKIITIPDIT
jgi:hypothetical protein